MTKNYQRFAVACVFATRLECAPLCWYPSDHVRLLCSLKTKFRNLSALHSKCAAQKSPAVHTSKPTPGKAARNRAFRELKPHHKNSRSIPQNTPRSVVRKTGVKKTTPAKVGTKMRSLTSAAGKNSIAEDKGPSVRSESRGSALESSLLASPAHARESVKRRRSKGHVAAPSPKVPKASPTLSTASLRSYRAAAESVNSEGKSLQMQRFLLPSQESTDSESPSKECHPTATQSPDGKNREHRSAVFAEVRPKDPTSPPAIVGPVVVNNVLPPKNTKPNRKNEFRVCSWHPSCSECFEWSSNLLLFRWCETKTKELV